MTEPARKMALETPEPRSETPPPSATPFPPGPWEPAIIQSLRYVLNPYRAIERSMRLYGHRVTTRIPGTPRTIIFSDPEAIRDIFMGDEDTMYAGQANASLLGPILGWNSILVLDAGRHLRERRLMLPPFHGERIQIYGRIMQEIADDVVARWPVGRPFPIHHEMQTITLEVILRAVFGVDERPKLERLRECLGRSLRLADGPSAAFLFMPALRLDLGGWSPWGRFVRDRRELHEILLAEIVRRRTEGTAGRHDVLSLLVDARDEGGEPMSDAELLDEMFTLLMAGHETTATSLSWTFYHVLPRPDVLERLRAELQAVAGDGGHVGAEHVGRLEYLDAVIKETARLTPVATNVMRILKKPARVGGLDLPAGVGVSAAIYAANHRADVWPDPERFDPDRFVGARTNPYAFFPFGGGMRRCLGAAFASYEMKVALASVLSRATPRIAPGYRMRPVLRAVTVAPSRGVPVIMDSPPV